VNPRDEPWFRGETTRLTPDQEKRAWDLAKKWLLLDVETEILHDGTQRRLRRRPESWSDTDVTLLGIAFGKPPFPGPSDPALVKRRVGGGESQEQPRRRKPAAESTTLVNAASVAGTNEVAVVPDARVDTNPAAERIASVARVLDEQARERDPVRRFVAAPALVVDPFGDEDPFSD
jgi:hypothetical protein